MIRRFWQTVRPVTLQDWLLWLAGVITGVVLAVILVGLIP